MKVYLIAGGSGFLGKGLACRLAKEKNTSVRILDILQQEVSPAGIQYFRGDVRKTVDLEAAVKGVDVVFNLASLLPCSRAKTGFYKVNTQGTANLLEACYRNGVKKVVHISSSVIYGIPAEVPLNEDSPAIPVGDYGRSKLLAENICLRYISRGMKVTILRPRFIVGPGRMGLLAILFDWISRNKNIYIIGNGENRFQMIADSDLIDACLLAASAEQNGIYNIGADHLPSVKQLLRELIGFARSSSQIVSVNPVIIKAVLGMLDPIRLSPFVKEHYLIADKDYILDTSKAKKELGWLPKYSPGEMLNSAYEWYLENRPFLVPPRQKLRTPLREGTNGHCMDEVISRQRKIADLPQEGSLRILKWFS